MIVVSKTEGSAFSVVLREGHEILYIFYRQIVGEGRDLAGYICTEVTLNWYLLKC